MKKIITLLILISIVIAIPSMSMAIHMVVIFPDTDFEKNVDDFISRYNTYINEYNSYDESMDKIMYRDFNIDNDNMTAEYKKGIYIIQLYADSNGFINRLIISADMNDISDDELSNATLNTMAFMCGCVNGFDTQITDDQLDEFYLYLLTDCKWELGDVDKIINGYSYDAHILVGFVGLSAKSTDTK